MAGANDRARDIAEALQRSERKDPTGVLGRVATALRSLTGRSLADAPPLDALELRGGLFRDDRWVRSATQPTVLSCTVDQLGSRLLFRGYGVRPGMRPIHAAMLAYDSVVLLDEAHISRPFQQTLDAIRRFAGDRTSDPAAPALAASEPVGPRPLVVVPMTATPARELPASELLCLEPDDREALAAKLTAAKPARIDTCTPAQLPKRLTQETFDLLRDGERPRVVGVIVNRVATAKAVHAGILKDARKHGLEGNRVHLVIGAMRPVDRDEQMKRLNAIARTGRAADADASPAVVVATQCIEVGADYDFDALVTQTASLDALRQRFGRLNRAGRITSAPAVVLHDGHKGDDPIYGDAAADTQAWLEEQATNGVVDFGIDAFDARWNATSRATRSKLLGPGSRVDAPVLLPTHLDLLAQTSPAGSLEPEIPLFLHGPQRDLATVGVCWRADLDPNLRAEEMEGAWTRRIEALPPTSTECMPVALGRFLAWTKGEKLDKDPSGDAASVADSGSERPTDLSRLWYVHRGGSTTSASINARPRPGDTIVLPAHPAAGKQKTPGLDLGHLPNAGSHAPVALDVAEPATLLARDRCALRLHPLLDGLGNRRVLRANLLSGDPERRPSEEDLRAELARTFIPWLKEDQADSFDASMKPQKPRIDFLAADNPDHRAFLLRLPARLGLINAAPGGVAPAASSREGERQSLDAHVSDVAESLEASLARLPLANRAGPPPRRRSP